APTIWTVAMPCFFFSGLSQHVSQGVSQVSPGISLQGVRSSGSPRMKAARPETKGESDPMILPEMVISSPGFAEVRAVWIAAASPLGSVARTLESSALGDAAAGGVA